VSFLTVSVESSSFSHRTSQVNNVFQNVFKTKLAQPLQTGHHTEGIVTFIDDTESTEDKVCDVVVLVFSDVFCELNNRPRCR